MGASTRIRLPLHVKGEHALHVIGKCVGVEFQLASFKENNGTYRRFDPNLPAGKSNSWHVDFTVPRTEFDLVPCAGHQLGFGHMIFTDIAEQKHRWSFHPETQFEDHKLLSPVSSSLAIAVGRRLVQFFGGDVEYNDNVENGPQYRRSPRSAIYPAPPRRIPDERVDSDLRWYLFHNALNAVPLITTRELHMASKDAGYGLTERDQALCDRLVVEEERQKLASRLTSIPSAPPRGAPRL